MQCLLPNLWWDKVQSHLLFQFVSQPVCMLLWNHGMCLLLFRFLLTVSPIFPPQGIVPVIVIVGILILVKIGWDCGKSGWAKILMTFEIYSLPFFSKTWYCLYLIFRHFVSSFFLSIIPTLDGKTLSPSLFLVCLRTQTTFRRKVVWKQSYFCSKLSLVCLVDYDGISLLHRNKGILAKQFLMQC